MALAPALRLGLGPLTGSKALSEAGARQLHLPAVGRSGSARALGIVRPYLYMRSAAQIDIFICGSLRFYPCMLVLCTKGLHAGAVHHRAAVIYSARIARRSIFILRIAPLTAAYISGSFSP